MDLKCCLTALLGQGRLCFCCSFPAPISAKLQRLAGDKQSEFLKFKYLSPLDNFFSEIQVFFLWTKLSICNFLYLVQCISSTPHKNEIIAGKSNGKPKIGYNDAHGARRHKIDVWKHLSLKGGVVYFCFHNHFMVMEKVHREQYQSVPF